MFNIFKSCRASSADKLVIKQDYLAIQFNVKYYQHNPYAECGFPLCFFPLPSKFLTSASEKLIIKNKCDLDKACEYIDGILSEIEISTYKKLKTKGHIYIKGQYENVIFNQTIDVFSLRDRLILLDRCKSNFTKS